jgi:hypothetical protein
VTKQIDLFEARELRDKGIEKAMSHANEVIPDWSEKAYQLLLEFLSRHSGPFMTEEVRSYAALVDFPLPPHARAFGGIMKRAATEGIIEPRGYAPVKNVKAHRTPARVWIQVKKPS